MGEGGRAAILLLCAISLPGPLRGQTFEFRDGFSKGMAEWERVRLDRRPTAYSVTLAGGEAVLVGTATNSAAGLVRRFVTPIPGRATVEWRWRIDHALAGDVSERSREGDDYAARVFVLFGDRPFRRGTRALSYVWASRQSPGSRYRNPVVRDVATFVLRSGDGYAQRWMDEQRDVVADYRAAFGEDPPALRGIAVVVDTDDTGSDAIAWFDDFVVRVWPSETPPAF